LSPLIPSLLASWLLLLGPASRAAVSPPQALDLEADARTALDPAAQSQDAGALPAETPAPPPEPTLPKLSFPQAVAQALARNDQLLDAQDEVVRAQLGLKLARSAFHPKVVPNILGSFGQTDVSNQTYRVDVVQKLTTGTELRASVGTSSAQIPGSNFYNADTTLQLSQPLLRGFGRTVARRGLTSAEVRIADAHRQRTLAQRQTVLQVAGAYYQLVAQAQMAAVSEKGLERARRLVEASTAKLEIGRVSQLDVYRAQQLAAQAEAQLLDARGAVEDAREQLCFLMGRGPGSAFAVESEIPREVETLDPATAVEVALSHRLELESAEAAVVEAERSASYAKNQLLPQVDLNLALTRRETADSFSSSFRFDHFRFATFFAISLPADLSAQSIELQTAVLDRGRRQRELETLKRRIGDEARRTLRQQARLVKSLELADASVDFALKEVEVADLRYQRGLSNNLDVVNAENGLLQAQSRRMQALAELAIARLALHATLGILDPQAVATDGPEPASLPPARALTFRAGEASGVAGRE
jgi:outer membrane protein TolC